MFLINTNTTSTKSMLSISFLFLLIVALLGTYLRMSNLFSSVLKYSNVVHAHSHTAFQGWIYSILFILLSHEFLSKKEFKKGKYSLQFVATFVVILGILGSFSIQGYGLYSIIFSTLFQVLNYIFFYSFLKQTKNKLQSHFLIPLQFIRTGLYIGFASTFLPFAIGITSAKGLAGSELYNSLIYTFMHLQYNGWFLFIALGLLYKLLIEDNDLIDIKKASLFHKLFTINIIPSISLSLLGMNYIDYIQPLAILSSIIQIIAIIVFVLSIKNSFRVFLAKKVFSQKLLFIVFLSSFLAKEILQSIAVFPTLSSFTFSNKPILLAYLHLCFIGVLSFLFIGFLFEKKYLALHKKEHTGIMLLLLGFVTSEVILTTSGLGLFSNQPLIIMGSALMMVGIAILLSNTFYHSPKSNKS